MSNLYLTFKLYRFVLPAAALLSSLLLPVTSSAQSGLGTTDQRNRNSSFGASAPGWQGSNWLGNSAARPQEWRLGVRGDNLETGVLIREVGRNSAAARARIEPGDLIVTVGGYQVGMVDGRLYDLAEEINRRADSRGVVSLVVQDQLGGRLSSVRVQLDGSQGSLTGSLTLSQRTALPNDAIVTVQIENVSRPFFSVRHGQTSFRPNIGGDIPFEIAFDPTYIDPQDVYQVRASVTSGGRTILSSQPQRILTLGNPSQVRLQLIPLMNLASNPGAGGVVTAGYPDFNTIDERIIAMYREYLRRDPTFLELAALRATPGIADRLDSMPLELMAAQEYFDASGNNNAVWLDRVFEEVVKRKASQSELQQWMQRYGDLRYSRTELLRQLFAQTGR